MSYMANISICGTGHTWAGPWRQNGQSLGSKIDFYIQGAYGFVSPCKKEKCKKKVIYFYIGHIPSQIWQLFQFLVWAIHGLAPGAKMAAPWGPKFISTFRGHIDLHHPVREKNVIYFNIGHLTCQIWPIFQFLRLCIY